MTGKVTERAMPTSDETPPTALAESAGPAAGLVAQVARVLAASLLPGEGDLSGAALAEAAGFVAGTAQTRAPEHSAVGVETVSGSAGARFMRIAVINEDMPFLVDSIANAVTASGLTIDRLVHPVLAVERDGAGRLLALPDDAAGCARESMVYIETPRADARARSRLAGLLTETLSDVRAAVADWRAMQAAMRGDADTLAAMDRAEGAALLRWFAGGMLTQLGHVQRRRDGSEASALGICRNAANALLSAASYTRAFAWFDDFAAAGGAGRLPLVIKSNAIARVHRLVPLDLIILPVIEHGAVTALSVHAGVWTSGALATPPAQVPRMRAQLSELMAKFGFDPAGHAGKALVHALTKLPHDLLIGFADDDLERVAMAMMSLIDRPRPRLALVAAPLERHLLAFVWLPRDALSTSVRLAIADMLETAAGADLLDWALEVESNSIAELRFVLDTRGKGHGALPDEASLNARLEAMLRGWSDAVEAELATGTDGGRAAAIATRFAEAFPPAYRAAYGAGEAATDIARLRRLGPDDEAGEAASRRDARLYRLPGDAEGLLRLKIAQRSGTIALSETVPVLEHFGFRVLEEVPTLLDGGRLGRIHDFQLAPAGAGLSVADVLLRGAEIETAVTAVLNGEAEDDAFNRLIAQTGLAATEANWLRAWYRYLRQAGSNFTVASVVDTLVGAPRVTLGLIALFRARHQPDFAGDRAHAEEAAEGQIREGLAGVAAISEDRLLRAFHAVVGAMLRSNVFAVNAATASDAPIAFKLDSSLIPGLPRPVPWREIWVYSPRVEGIHLRAGPIARGGIRWSDRRDDFRTEVLGLMKAQRVKNAVIVPTGAKGGFYPKALPDASAGRDAWAAEGLAAYTAFITALLTLTDNIDDAGAVIHPAGVVVRDGDDPYFVVAADKGTASFSDTANAIAASFDFWLDDAFASGGSKGYDHKAMGITARGAWLSVQRHFRELGVDVQTDAVRVVGVGDMSGDVFGNGMLLSKSLRLIAAFDHRHIFIDPNPDPAAAWAERDRMFKLPRSSWADYDQALISKGGGVFPRTLKTIDLSEEARVALGIEAASVDPETLLRAILLAPADLLWFGGIGTYVKGASEANIAVGDPANDAIRIDGAQVRARVIGEGANLGCTQAGRIEYALTRKGGADGKTGRINTDFIDNSAGVDCSDKEVNIKIALASAKRAGRLTEDGRVALLIAMTDGVAELVLEDNRLQALGLSIAEASGAAAIPSEERLIEELEEGGNLDRKNEGLADADVLTRRALDGKGMTRPELAVLLSSAKLVLQDALEHGSVPDDPGLEGELLNAFPPEMRGEYRADILAHRLRREILATRIANRLVNRLGFIHPFELAEEEGVALSDVAGAFLAAESLLGMGQMWVAIETADMPEAARILLFERAAHGLRGHMADLLRAGATGAAPTALAAELAPGVAELTDGLDDLLSKEARAQSRAMQASLVAAGAAPDEAAMVARLYDMDGAAGLARLARDSGIAAPALAGAFTDLGSRLGIGWAQSSAARMSPSDPWDRLLVAGLAGDFQHMRLDFLRRLAAGERRKGGIGSNGGGAVPDLAGNDPGAAVTAWLEAHEPRVRQFRRLIARAQATAPVTPAMLAQIATQARNLLAR